MEGLPSGSYLEVPNGWSCIAFFEPIIKPGLASMEALTGTVPLTETTYAARLSPKEVFEMFRVLDFRLYCELVQAEMRRSAAEQNATSKGHTA